MKYAEQNYLRYDPFEGDRDVDVRCRTVKMVKVKKSHRCHDSLWKDTPHDIQPGEMARYESAIVDGSWGRYYICVPCMNHYLELCGVTPLSSQSPAAPQ